MNSLGLVRTYLNIELNIEDLKACPNEPLGLNFKDILCNIKSWVTKWFCTKEGVIIEWPLNWLFHDRCDMIITSRMVVIRFLSNDGRYLKCRNFVILIKEIPAISLDKKVSLFFAKYNHDRKS